MFANCEEEGDSMFNLIKRRGAMGRAIAIAMIMPIAASGGSSASATPMPSTGLDGEGTLEVSDWAADNEFYAEWIAEVNADFEAKYPGWTVDFTNIPASDYVTVMVPPMSTGQGPDVYPFLSEELESTIANGWLLPLDDYLATSDLAARLPDWVIDLSTVDGSTYALARAATPQMLHSNMALLEEAGIQEVPETPDEFVDAAIAVNEATGEWGYAPFLDGAEPLFFYRTIAQWAIGYGSDFGSPGRITIDVPEIRDAMTDLKRLVDSGAVPFGLTYSDARQIFMDGQAAFLIDGTWIAGEALTTVPELFPSLDVTHVPFPTRNSLTGGGWVGINASSSNPDAAWAWIEEYFSEKSVDAWVEGSLRPAGTTDPAPESVYEIAPWYSRVEDVAANFTTQLGYAPPGFKANAAEFRTEMVPFFVDILTGETTVEDGLSAAQAHMEEWAEGLDLLTE